MLSPASGISFEGIDKIAAANSSNPALAEIVPPFSIIASAIFYFTVYNLNKFSAIVFDICTLTPIYNYYTVSSSTRKSPSVIPAFPSTVTLRQSLIEPVVHGYPHTDGILVSL